MLLGPANVWEYFFFFTGPKPHLSKEASWESSTELPVPATAEEAMPSAPGMLQGMALPVDGREWGRDAHTAEGSLLQPPNPPTAQEEPLVSTAPGGYVLSYSLGTHSLAGALEAVFTAWLMHGTKACVEVGKLLPYLFRITESFRLGKPFKIIIQLFP